MQRYNRTLNTDTDTNTLYQPGKASVGLGSSMLRTCTGILLFATLVRIHYEYRLPDLESVFRPCLLLIYWPWAQSLETCRAAIRVCDYRMCASLLICRAACN